MRTESKLSLFLAVYLIITGVARPCLAQAAHSGQQPAKGQNQDSKTPGAEDTADSEEQTSEEGEPAPAAVQLDVSGTSPLIQELYYATRETKEKAILER